MFSNSNKLICIFAVVVASLALPALAETTARIPADSTEKNVRDSSMQTLTPEDQSKGSAADVELTRKIRQELTSNDNLSTYAQNVKIITLNGRVNLRGPVKTQAEKDLIGRTAKNTAGVQSVNNSLEIAK